MQRHRRGGSHGYPRTARVNALIHEVVAEEIERLADADERLLLLTVTGVECEPDYRRAVVYLASIGEPAAEALEERRRGLQSVIASQVRLKRVPTLVFAADPAIESGNRIEDALRRVAAARPDEAAPPPAPAPGADERP